MSTIGELSSSGLDLQGRLVEAVDAYERALAAAPNFEIVRNNLAIALTELGTRTKMEGGPPRIDLSVCTRSHFDGIYAPIPKLTGLLMGVMTADYRGCWALYCQLSNGRTRHLITVRASNCIVHKIVHE